MARKQAELVVKLSDEFSRNASEIGRALRNLSKGLTDAGRSLTVGLTLPLAALGGASLKAFGEFEKAIANVSTLVDESSESIAAMREAVLEIGNRTAVPLAELSAALYDIRSAGIAASDAMGVLENSGRLALAGLGTTKEAADLATSAINAFGLQGAEQTRVFELLFRTVAAGKTNIAELGQAFGGVVGVVANAGVELDEFLASVAALTTTGLPAAQAQTQLRAAIVGLTRDSADLRVVLEQLGAKNFADLVQKSGGLVAAFQRISKAVGGDAGALIKLTGSAEGYNAIIALTGRQNDVFTRTLAGMRSGVDSLDAAVQKQSATFDAKVTQMRNQIESVVIAIGEELVPKISELFQFVGELAEGFRGLSPRLKSSIVDIGLFAAAIGPALIVLGTLVRSIGAVAGALGKLRLLLAASPGGALLAGVGLIGAGIALWSQHAGSATAAMEAHQSVVDKVGAAYGAAGRQVAAMSRAIKDGLLVEARTSMQQLIKALGNAVTEFKQKAGIFAESETFGPVVKQFLEGAIAVDKFIAEVDRLAVANPKLNHIAQALRDAAKTSLDLFADAGETTDLMLLLTDQITDTQFEARRLAREGIAPVAVEVKKLGAVADETTDKIADLGETITVTRNMPGVGLVSTIFPVVDGVVEGLEEVQNSSARAQAGITDMYGALRTAPQALAGGQSVGEVLTEGLDQAEVEFQALPAVARAATDGVIAEVGRIDAAFAGLGGTAPAGGEGAGGAATGLAAALVQLQEIATAAVDAIVAAFARLGPETAVSFAQIPLTAETEFSGTVGSAETAAGGIVAAFAGLAATLQATFAAIATAIRSQLTSLEAAVKALVSRLAAELKRLQAAIASAKAKAGAGGSGDKGLARGGYVWGPGTSISDSIPARLSRGEFVINARAVKKLGLSWLRLINAGRLAGKQLRGAIPGYAQGGLVGGLDVERLLAGMAGALGGNVLQPRLAIAGGGSLAPQRSLRPINLTMPGGETFELLADETVAEKVMRFATGAQLRTAGRKPGWSK